MALRYYQKNAQAAVLQAWREGVRNVLLVSATGSGKTITTMDLARQLLPARGVVQAHRGELVAQLSVALAGAGVPHDLTCNKSTRRDIVDEQIETFGRSYYSPDAAWAVESVDTAIKRTARANVQYVITDEAHHVQQDNKWGRAVAAYENARALGVTASACRGDGGGLGVHHGGIYNHLVPGPGSAQMMAEGYLCAYAIKVAVPEGFNMQGVAIGSNGEYNQQQLHERIRGKGASIVGNAVEQYLLHAPGRLCICFAVDIEHAHELERRYRAAGVAAEVVTGLSTDRSGALRRFRRRETTVLINVDLFGEGFDVPACEVVQMCRPTASFALFLQMVGRALRLDIAKELHAIWESLTVEARLAYIAMSAKPQALVLDHVGNFVTEFRVGDAIHVGPPELFTGWDLNGRTKQRKPGDPIPLKMCLNKTCGLAYEAYHGSCPYCGHMPPAPPPASLPKEVAGNMYDFSPELLAQLRAEIARIDGAPRIPDGLSGAARVALVKKWHERQAAQKHLRDAIAIWAGSKRWQDDAANYRLFYYKFGVDVPTTLTLSASDAARLTEKVMKDATSN